MILLLVMFASVFFRFRQKGEILMLPVATLFAFTQLRASMPGVPDGFGDILGTWLSGLPRSPDDEGVQTLGNSADHPRIIFFLSVSGSATGTDTISTDLSVDLA